MSTFSGIENDPDDSILLIMGVPFDSTSTRVAGSRFAPKTIRDCSWELESYNPRLDRDVEELPVADLGDLSPAVTFNQLSFFLEKTLKRIDFSEKKLFSIGGDHSISIPILEHLASRYGTIQTVVLDAHLDLRDEYPIGEKISHATVFRRLVEKTDVKVAYLNPRAFSREEYIFARNSPKIAIFDDITSLMNYLRETNYPLYISIDIDYIDPAFAPAVGNPEPLGSTPQDTLKALSRIISLKGKSVLGIDLVEVNPLLDINNVTSFLAAKIIQEILFAITSTIA